MKIQRAKIDQYQTIWLVLDDNGLPITPIEAFLTYLFHTEKSPHTRQTYAHHLKLYWQYVRAFKIDWQAIRLEGLAHFVGWLRQMATDHKLHDLYDKRCESTVNTILATISSFYRYHNQLGATQVQLIEPCQLPINRYRSLLYHIYKDKPRLKRIIHLKIPKTLPKTLSSEQIKQLFYLKLDIRDRFLIMLLYETGMRIGQALTLRHGDIRSFDQEIDLIYRTDNANGMRNKTKQINVVHVSSPLMHLYSQYVETYADHFSNGDDYVFINLSNFNVLTYSAVRKIFARLSQQAGFYIRPHMLRHTHATELIQFGWDASFVQKRLGHRSVQTTINRYVHLNQQDLKKAFQQYQTKRKNGVAK
jgi:integrase/recombinase XerD